ncbi:Patatin-like phospholipase [Georgenia satyanarayanai]|uniref:Patatin-like phospholipase n=1 Tax=Georgenia satyanarayanai TaxID=860221 RepID=A0A2Y9ALF1_9MICO|nr:patatin-like phospholipase family protein [Georgenia satyanarayanai]PYF98388.1 patatin-like phospholipase [Georgenia satyanarayanai]SSA45015.1 Patatin-like phospholipase [Georgenia satyanarayanai]
MPDAPDVVGLVLSGGGARASFQLGALRYLYDRAGIAPSVITGTSAGSIVAAVLAQSAEREGQRAALARLEELWRGMADSSDMFEELPWFSRLRERGPVWAEALERRKRRQGALGRSFKRVAVLRDEISTAAERVVRPASGDGRSTQDPGPDEPPHQQPVELPPVPAPPSRLTPAGEPADEEAAGTGRERAGGTGLGPGRFLESIDILRTVGRASADLETIVDGARRERSMYRPGPIVDHLVDPEIFRPDAVAASGVTLRVAVVALESGELRYVTEDGTLVDRDDRPLGADPVDLVEAVRASCAIPMVFAPVRLGEENYVDGGVRESLPAEVAMTHLGVDTCYAVVAGPSGLRREDSYDDKDMLGILMRTTTAIMTDEVQRDEVVRARAAGAVVIEPEFDVHDTLTIEPGLVALAMDYGYLRAAEAVLGASAEEQSVTRDLVLLRRRIWHAEKEAFAADLEEPARLERVAEIAGLKYTLRDLLRRVPADRLPEGAEEWWRTWEHHRTEITLAPSWATPRT